MNTLHNVYDNYKTVCDCGTGDKGTIHSYIDIYEDLFKSYRDQPINLLEIGIAGGSSLQMWKSYFHKDSNIYGIDLDNNGHKNIDLSGINLLYGDATKVQSFPERHKF